MTAIAEGVRSTVRSSVADWSDVIGDEIATIKSIESIHEEPTDLVPKTVPQDSQAADRSQRREVDRLIRSLPPSLRGIAEEKARDPVQEVQDLLETEYAETNTVVLRAFWDPSMELDFSELRVGKPFLVRIGKTIGTRILSISVCNVDGKAAGIVVNKYRTKYYLFREALARFFRGTKIQAEVIGIEDKKLSGTRIYFRLKVAPEAFEHREAFYREITAKEGHRPAPARHPRQAAPLRPE